MFIRSKQYYPVSSGNFISDSTLISSNSRQSDFCTRLCVETHHTYNIGGVVCLLTLTYSNDCLPYAINSATSERFPCFSRLDIRKFLNLLKVRMYRANVSYKYFLCCEFGDKTKRPHYHLLGFLHNKDHIKIFLDTIREIWSYGIVFPAPYGNPYAAAVLRSPRNGAAYASKYVCKDLSFWSLPALKTLC
ncbi:replication initiator [Microviridae IME-16]|uniref:replication initiator n=1 Tax=Microviridae IME-16 TaxID=1544364 RepID=UPI0004F7B547|nr:replication initiator [Microviridae IME-16]AIN52143.1 replication initiator [Microviridae IME-16]